jgi:hypothetical protein
MKKFLDLLLELFMGLYGIFLYSLILPLGLGMVIVFIYPFATWLQRSIFDLGYLMYPFFIAVGMGLKYWRTKKIWNH